MPTLEINGKRVEVDDSFLSLSPDQQQETVNEIAASFNAPSEPQQEAGALRKAEAFGQGAAQGLTFQFADEGAAHLGTMAQNIGTYLNPFAGRQDYKKISDDYGENIDAVRERFAETKEMAPGYEIAGQIAGGLTNAAGLAKSGATFLRSGQSLPKQIGLGFAEGGMHGAAHGFGGGEGIDDRLAGAGTGAAVGAALGGAAPAAIQGVKAGANAIGSALQLGSRGRANQALDVAINRSGKSADELEDAIIAAHRDGQSEYAFVDALGDPGQRMFNAVVRTPGDESTAARQFLVDRQVGQGQRIGQILAEGMDAPQTKRQFKDATKQARNAAADIDYDRAVQTAGLVDTRPVAARIDTMADPSGYRAAGLKPDALTRKIASIRPQLVNADNSAWLSDPRMVYRVRKSINDEASKAYRAGEAAKYRELKMVVDEIDAALEVASPAFKRARENYAQISGVIDAADAGADATATNARSADVLGDFRQMSPAEQRGFRVGYNDKLQGRIDARSMSPTTNKLQPLMSGKFGQELPHLAAPGRGNQMMTRLGREREMWETAEKSLGNSRTADNLADQADLQNFDPGLVEALLRGSVSGVVQAGTRGVLNATRGLDPRTRQLIADALMSNNPVVVRSRINQALIRGNVSAKRKAAIIKALGAAPGQVTAQ